MEEILVWIFQVDIALKVPLRPGVVGELKNLFDSTENAIRLRPRNPPYVVRCHLEHESRFPGVEVLTIDALRVFGKNTAPFVEVRDHSSLERVKTLPSAKFLGLFSTATRRNWVNSSGIANPKFSVGG